MTEDNTSDIHTFTAGNRLRPNIRVERDDFAKAVEHGCELYWDGSTPTKRLDQRNDRSGFTRFVNARVEGKLSEVAFSDCLELYHGIESQVDWRIYGDYEETDDGDLQYIVGDDGEHYPPSVAFDVKKTKPWNQWLAVRDEIFTRIPDDAPIVLTKLSLEDDLVLDEWEDAGEWEAVDQDPRFRERLLEYADTYFPLDVRIVGTVYKDEFTDDFDEGDHLYDPERGAQLGNPLRRPNMGVHESDLVATPERWNRVVNDITSDIPVEPDPHYVVDDRDD